MTRNMKAAKLYAFDNIRVEETPVPEVGPGQALVRTRASGVCSGEVMPWYIERKAPVVLGHEPAGEVVEVGKGVNTFRLGDRVFVHHHAPCMACGHCARGDYVQCLTWKDSRIIPGGIAEYILVPEVNLSNDTIILPDDVSFEDATLIEPLACVLKGIGRTGVPKGIRALVLGMGTMGILNLLALIHLHDAEVIGADLVPSRIERAASLGAAATIDSSDGDTTEQLAELTSGKMADLVVVAPPIADALRTGIKCVAPGGTVLMFSPVAPGGSVADELNELYFKDAKLITSYSAGPPDTSYALAVIESEAVRAGQMVTHRFPIERTAEAYRLTAEGRDSLKCIIVFP